MDLGGAGVETIYHESIISPGLGARDGIIIKLVRAQKMIEVDFEEYVEGESFYAAELYRWDGREASLIKQDPGILGWFEKATGDKL